MFGGYIQWGGAHDRKRIEEKSEQQTSDWGRPRDAIMQDPEDENKDEDGGQQLVFLDC